MSRCSVDNNSMGLSKCSPQGVFNPDGVFNYREDEDGARKVVRVHKNKHKLLITFNDETVTEADAAVLDESFTGIDPDQPIDFEAELEKLKSTVKQRVDAAIEEIKALPHKGDKGDTGAVYTPSFEGTVLSFTNNSNLPNPPAVDLKGGKGDKGKDGASYTFSISDEGILTISNDQNLPVPAPFKIKGEQGIDGNTGKSAYQSAVENGFKGSEQDWVNSFLTKPTLDAALKPINTNINELLTRTRVIGGINYLNDSAKEVTSTNEYVMYRRSPELKELLLGKTFVVSFDIKVELAGSVTVYSSNQSGISYSASVNIPEANKWFRRHVVINAVPSSNTPDNPNGTLEFYGQYNTGRIITVRNVKLELGNIPTDWTLSLEDQKQERMKEIEVAVDSTIEQRVRSILERGV